MKNRKFGFLSGNHINQKGEPFDYIKELHSYLWRFINVEFPNAAGSIEKYLDVTIEKMEAKAKKKKIK